MKYQLSLLALLARPGESNFQYLDRSFGPPIYRLAYRNAPHLFDGPPIITGPLFLDGPSDEDNEED